MPDVPDSKDVLALRDRLLDVRRRLRDMELSATERKLSKRTLTCFAEAGVGIADALENLDDLEDALDEEA